MMWRLFVYRSSSRLASHGWDWLGDLANSDELSLTVAHLGETFNASDAARGAIMIADLSGQRVSSQALRV